MISPDDTNSNQESHDASREPLPNSTRVYVEGSIHPELKVPMREISQSDTKGLNGKIETNDPIRVYDCSGPWGDPEFTGTVEEGLPALRRDWILARGDVDVALERFVDALDRDAHLLERVQDPTSFLDEFDVALDEQFGHVRAAADAFLGAVHHRPGAH